MPIIRRKRPIYADTYTKKRWLRWLALLVVVLLAGAGSWWWHHRQSRPSVRRYPVMGVVLDQTDGAQDFSALAQHGVRFAYLKASQGASYTDDDFTVNFQHATNMPVGVYHVFSFDSSAAAQARQFIATVGRNTGRLPLGIAVAYYGAYAHRPPRATAMRQKLATLIRLLQTHYHRPVVLMGSAAVLQRVAAVSPTSARWVIGRHRPTLAQARYWQYGTAHLPGGRATYRSVVFIGSKRAFSAQQGQP